jgi:tetratricopeptide (TPR) repeat protein
MKDEIRSAQRLVESNQTLLGDAHPDTLMALTNLGLVYRDAGDLERARVLLEGVLVELRRTEGDEAYSVLRVEGLLGGVLFGLGNLTGARRLEEHALEAFERSYGPTHESTLIAIKNLSGTLYESGEYEESIQLEERILAGEGVRHSWVLDLKTGRSMARIAKARRAMKEYQKARELDEAVIEKVRGLGDIRLLLDAKRCLLEDLFGLKEWEAGRDLVQEILDDGLRELRPGDDLLRDLKKNKRKLQRMIKKSQG